MAGSLIAYQGFRALSVTARRARGFEASISTCIFPVSAFPDGFSFVTPAEGEEVEEIDRILPPLDSIRSGKVKPLGVQDRMHFGGSLLLAEEEDETWQVVLHPLYCIRLSRVFLGEGGRALVQATLADARYFWGRGYLGRWSFNRMRINGEPARDSVKGDGQPFTLAEIAGEVVGSLPGAPSLAAYPERWEEEQGPQEFLPFSPPILALTQVCDGGGAEAPCLRLDGQVELRKPGDGFLGYAEGGEGPNSLPLPKRLMLYKQGTGQGYSVDAKYPPPFALVRGGKTIASVALDNWEPCLQINNKFPLLDEDLVRELTGGQFGMDWLKRFVLSKPAYQGSLNLPEEVTKLFREQAWYLFRLPGAVVKGAKGLGVGGKVEGGELQTGPNAHLLPLLPRAESIGTGRLPVTVERFGYRVTHRQMLGGGSGIATKLQGLTGERDKVLREIMSLPFAHDIVDGAVGRVGDARIPGLGRGAGSFRSDLFLGGSEGDRKTSTVEFLKGLGVLDAEDYPGTDALFSDLSDKLRRAERIERMRDIEGAGSLVSKYDALSAEIYQAQDQNNGTTQANSYKLAKALIAFEKKVKEAATSGAFGDVSNFFSALVEGDEGALRELLKKDASVRRLADSLRNEVDDALRTAERESQARKEVEAIGGNPANLVAAASVQFVENLTSTVGADGSVTYGRRVDAHARILSKEAGVIATSQRAGHVSDDVNGKRPADLWAGKFIPLPVRVCFGATVRPRTDQPLGVVGFSQRARPITGISLERKAAAKEGGMGDIIPEALTDQETWYHSAYKRHAVRIEKIDAVVEVGPLQVTVEDKVAALAVEKEDIKGGAVAVIPRSDLIELIPLEGESNRAELDKAAKGAALQLFAVKDTVASRTHTLARVHPINCDGIIAATEWVSREGGAGFETIIHTGDASKLAPWTDTTIPRARPSTDGSARSHLL